MKQSLLLVLGSLAVVVGASAATLDCAAAISGGPVNVLAPPPFSCMSAGLTFSNFFAANAGNAANPTVFLTGVSNAGGFVNLSFNPNLTPPTGQTIADVDFGFSVSGGINQLNLGVFGNGATISEEGCTAPFTTQVGIISTSALTTCSAGGNGGTLRGTLGANSSLGTITSPAFPTTSPVYVFKDLNVNNASTTGTALLSNFQQSFHSVPEPVSMVLMGSGLLALSVLRRRSSKA